MNAVNKIGLSGFSRCCMQASEKQAWVVKDNLGGPPNPVIVTIGDDRYNIRVLLFLLYHYYRVGGPPQGQRSLGGFLFLASPLVRRQPGIQTPSSTSRIYPKRSKYIW